MDCELFYVNVRLTASNIEKKESCCNDCRKIQKFPSEQALKKHIIIDHNYIDFNRCKNSIVFCYFCPVLNCRKNEKFNDKFFHSRKHLVQHYLKVHSKNLGQFSCDLCSKKFSTQSLRNHHVESCGKLFTCFVCNQDYNSYEALLTHAKRKGHNHENLTKSGSVKLRKSEKIVIKSEFPATRSVATTTVETSRLQQTSVFTSTGDLTDLFPDTTTSNRSVASTSETKATTTDDISAFLNDDLVSSTSCSKIIKNSSTSTTVDDFFTEDSNSSSNKKNVNLNSANVDFSEDSLNIFDPNRFYSAETQTDFESLFNNNFTQTTFDDLDVFEKFDSQTQTNWIELENTLFTSTETQTMNIDEDISFI